MLRLLNRPSLLLAAALALAGAVGCVSLDEWQRQALFSPAKDNPRWSSEPLPGTEQYDVKLANGHTLQFWYIPQPDAARAPTVLYLHGARWNLNGSVFRMSRWVDLAAGPLKEPGNEIGGIVIEATFTSIPAVVRETKWGWVPGISLAVTQTFDSAAKIGRVNAPLLIIHGTADNIVPHTMADQLYAAASSRDKQLVKIDGATHSGASRVGGATYRDAVLGFVRRASSATAAISSTAASSSSIAAEGVR